MRTVRFLLHLGVLVALTGCGSAGLAPALKPGDELTTVLQHPETWRHGGIVEVFAKLQRTRPSDIGGPVYLARDRVPNHVQLIAEIQFFQNEEPLGNLITTTMVADC